MQRPFTRAAPGAQAAVQINCAAIPFELLESELFGYEKGAFSEPFANKIGRFRNGRWSTLFLDEIERHSIGFAAKAAATRPTGKRVRTSLGSGLRPSSIDIRLIAAVRIAILPTWSHGTQFRSDISTIDLNSISDCAATDAANAGEDISLLVSHFVEIFSRRMGRADQATIPERNVGCVHRLLLAGNVRELQNLIERAVILSENRSACTNPLLINWMGTC